jgi:hypothetical protein
MGLSAASRYLSAWRQVWPSALLILVLAITLAPGHGVRGFLYAGVTAGGLVLWGSRARTQTWEVARYVLGFVIFTSLRHLADDLGPAPRVIYPIRGDRALFGEVPTLALQHAFVTPGHSGVLDYTAVSVYLSYFLVPPAVLVLLWRYWPGRLRRYVSATFILFGVSGIIHLMLPTAPPWLASQMGALPPVVPVLPLLMGDAVPHTYHAGMGLSGNLVAAMPSVHLGVTTLMLLALWHTPLRWVAGAYLIAMSVAVVYTGDHYAVDVLAGMALAGVGWILMAPRGQAGGRAVAG